MYLPKRVIPFGGVVLLIVLVRRGTCGFKGRKVVVDRRVALLRFLTVWPLRVEITRRGVVAAGGDNILIRCRTQ